MKKLLLTLSFSACSLLMLAQNNWSKATDMPAAWRHHPICFTVGDTAYVVTGVTNGNAMLNDFYAYVPGTDTWIQKSDYPGPNRGFGVGLTHKGKAYIGFGVSGTNSVLGDLWEFDQATQTWTALASLPASASRFHPAFVAKDDKLYVGLGAGNSGNRDDWWEYDITADTWTQKASFIGDQRHHPYYFTVNNEIYVGLGHGNTSTGTNLIYKDWYRYDVPSDTWIQMADFPSYARVAGTHFAMNGLGYVLGGQNQFHSTPSNNEVWAYEPTADVWTQMPDCPSGGRWAPGSFVAGGMAFFGFGENTLNVSQGDIWSISLSDFIGANESLDATQLKLFPNPASEKLEINLAQLNAKGQDAILIYSITGQLVKREILNENKLVLDVSTMDKGVYTIGLESSKDVSSFQKLIIE